MFFGGKFKLVDFEIVVSVLMIIIPIFIVILSVKARYNHMTGQGLEKRVYGILRGFEKHGGKTIRNCYLIWKDGYTSEIDNILIHKKGVFVIECKDYRGWIFGRDIDAHWTEVFKSERGNTKKYSFYNPIKQNGGHIRAIRNKIRDFDVPFYSIIVFSNECSFANITNNTEVDIIKEKILYKTVCRLMECSRDVLSYEDVEKYYKILCNDVLDKEIAVKHIANVESLKRAKGF